MTMKRTLVALALALTASGALAAPAAPRFNTPVKIGEGLLGYQNIRPVVSGSTIYATYGTNNVENGSTWPESVRLVKSTNAGATWDLSLILARSTVAASDYVDSGSARVAVSNDPAASGQKIVHTAWVSYGGSALFYSFFRTQNPGAGRSTPLVMPAPYDDSYSAPAIIIAPSNAVHVFLGGLGKVYQYTAPGAGQPFSGPFVLPIPADTLNLGTPSVAVDSAGTLHVAFVKDNGDLYYTKKTSSASTWSSLVRVYASPSQGDLSNNIGLALADASNVYVVFNEGDSGTWDNLRLASTANGGTSWVVRTALSGPSAWSGTTWPSIVATSTRVVTIATEIPSADWSSSTVKLWRTADAGLSWSPPATIRGQETPALALDANNKVHVLVRDEVFGQDPYVYGNLLWMREK